LNSRARSNAGLFHFPGQAITIVARARCRYHEPVNITDSRQAHRFRHRPVNASLLPCTPCTQRHVQGTAISITRWYDSRSPLLLQLRRATKPGIEENPTPPWIRQNKRLRETRGRVAIRHPCTTDFSCLLQIKLAAGPKCPRHWKKQPNHPRITTARQSDCKPSTQRRGPRHTECPPALPLKARPAHAGTPGSWRRGRGSRRNGCHAPHPVAPADLSSGWATAIRMRNPLYPPSAAFAKAGDWHKSGILFTHFRQKLRQTGR